MDHGLLQCFRSTSILARSFLSSGITNNNTANALGIFSPAITLVIFAAISAARGRNLDTETVFTTMAILSMVTHPANMVMTIVPRAVASFAGFERIQTFLLQPSLVDHREILPNYTRNSMSWNPGSGHLTKPCPTIFIQHLDVGNEQPILCDISLETYPGSLVIISGAVASGKSTLLRAILGEVVPLSGVIKTSTRRIAYCAQRPWIPGGTIKDVVCGDSEYVDERWYDEIMSLCCLLPDIQLWSDGDATQVGSRGSNLSGGQRQRLVRGMFISYYIR